MMYVVRSPAPKKDCREIATQKHLKRREEVSILMMILEYPVVPLQGQADM